MCTRLLAAFCQVDHHAFGSDDTSDLTDPKTWAKSLRVVSTIRSVVVLWAAYSHTLLRVLPT
jgi:hypothetical protein